MFALCFLLITWSADSSFHVPASWDERASNKPEEQQAAASQRRPSLARAALLGLGLGLGLSLTHAALSEEEGQGHSCSEVALLSPDFLDFISTSACEEEEEVPFKERKK